MHHPDHGGSTCVGKEPCPKCDSRDNLARYDDGHGFCFGCGHYDHGTERAVAPTKGTRVDTKFVKGEARDLPKRGLLQATCEKWGYTVGTHHGRPVQIATYRDANGRAVGQKLRYPDKSFEVVGDLKAAGLYGQHLWRDGGKMVVVTEGEIDALTVSQLQQNKWPTVSVPNGAQAAKKAVQASLEWLEKFDTVVFMFDDDEPGRAAAAACAPLLTPGKAKIARIDGFKDANAALQAGKGAAVLDAMWGAKEWRPDGVVAAADLVEAASAPIPTGTPWCFDELTKWTHGRRPGEVYAVGAGTGVGKTDFFTQQIEYDVMILKKKVGVLYLEQPPVETIRRIAGKHAGKPLHIPGLATPEEVREAVEALASTKRLFLYDHFGSSDWETIKARIRYMVVSLGCEHIYLDHLTALAAQEEDERKALDAIMSEMAGQAQELHHVMHFISHLATPEGKPHEEGGRVMIRHFRGARSIGFWSHFMFGLERNQQADDVEERSTTILRCLKDRNTGAGTGKTMRLLYDRGAGLLTHDASPFEEEAPSGKADF